MGIEHCAAFPALGQGCTCSENLVASVTRAMRDLCSDECLSLLPKSRRTKRRGISIVNRHVQHHQALGTDRTTAEMSNGHGREPRNPRLYGTPCYAPSTTQSPHTSPSSTTCSSSSSQPLPAEDQSYQPLPVEDHDCVCHASYEWGNRTSTTSNRRLRQTSPTTRNSAPCQIARPTKTLPYNRRPQCWPPLRRPSSSSSPREPLQKP